MSPRNLDKFIAEKGSLMTTNLTSFRNNASSNMRKAAETVFGFPGISSSPSAFVDGRCVCACVEFLHVCSVEFLHVCVPRTRCACCSDEKRPVGEGPRAHQRYVLP